MDAAALVRVENRSPVAKTSATEGIESLESSDIDPFVDQPTLSDITNQERQPRERSKSRSFQHRKPLEQQAPVVKASPGYGTWRRGLAAFKAACMDMFDACENAWDAERTPDLMSESSTSPSSPDFADDGSRPGDRTSDLMNESSTGSPTSVVAVDGSHDGASGDDEEQPGATFIRPPVDEVLTADGIGRRDSCVSSSRSSFSRPPTQANTGIDSSALPRSGARRRRRRRQMDWILPSVYTCDQTSPLIEHDYVADGAPNERESSTSVRLARLLDAHEPQYLHSDLRLYICSDGAGTSGRQVPEHSEWHPDRQGLTWYDTGSQKPASLRSRSVSSVASPSRSPTASPRQGSIASNDDERHRDLSWGGFSVSSSHTPSSAAAPRSSFSPPQQTGAAGRIDSGALGARSPSGSSLGFVSRLDGVDEGRVRFDRNDSTNYEIHFPSRRNDSTVNASPRRASLPQRRNQDVFPPVTHGFLAERQRHISGQVLNARNDSTINEDRKLLHRSSAGHGSTSLPPDTAWLAAIDTQVFSGPDAGATSRRKTFVVGPRAGSSKQVPAGGKGEAPADPVKLPGVERGQRAPLPSLDVIRQPASNLDDAEALSPTYHRVPMRTAGQIPTDPPPPYSRRYPQLSKLRVKYRRTVKDIQQSDAPATSRGTDVPRWDRWRVRLFSTGQIESAPVLLKHQMPIDEYCRLRGAAPYPNRHSLPLSLGDEWYSGGRRWGPSPNPASHQLPLAVQTAEPEPTSPHDKGQTPHDHTEEPVSNTAERLPVQYDFSRLGDRFSSTLRTIPPGRSGTYSSILCRRLENPHLRTPLLALEGPSDAAGDPPVLTYERPSGIRSRWSLNRWLRWDYRTERVFDAEQRQRIQPRGQALAMASPPKWRPSSPADTITLTTSTSRFDCTVMRAEVPNGRDVEDLVLGGPLRLRMAQRRLRESQVASETVDCFAEDYGVGYSEQLTVAADTSIAAHARSCQLVDKELARAACRTQELSADYHEHLNTLVTSHRSSGASTISSAADEILCANGDIDSSSADSDPSTLLKTTRLVTSLAYSLVSMETYFPTPPTRGHTIIERLAATCSTLYPDGNSSCAPEKDLHDSWRVQAERDHEHWRPVRV